MDKEDKEIMTKNITERIIISLERRCHEEILIEFIKNWLSSDYLICILWSNCAQLDFQIS